jgi:hypothetical protein
MNVSELNLLGSAHLLMLSSLSQDIALEKVAQ